MLSALAESTSRRESASVFSRCVWHMKGTIISSKGIGDVLLQTLVKRYDRGEQRALVCSLKELSKGDIDLESRRQVLPLSCFASFFCCFFFNGFSKVQFQFLLSHEKNDQE